MKIAIDLDTAMLQMDFEVGSFILGRLRQRDTVTAYTRSPGIKSYCIETHAIPVVCLKEGEQAQDVISADIWITGRPDRVVGLDQMRTVLEQAEQ